MRHLVQAETYQYFNIPHRYKYLDKKFPGNAGPMVARKLAVDALILTPINLTIFYVGKLG